MTVQRLPSLTAEIRNRCSRRVVAFCRRNHSSSRQRKTESDADLVAATTTAGGTILRRGNGVLTRTRTSLPLRPLQAEPFFFAATKIRIGRGPRCRYDCSMRNHSSSQQRKLESAADLVAATAAAGGPFSFAATKIRIGCGPRCRYDCSRRNRSSLRQRRLESDEEPRCRYGRSRRAILYRHEDCAASIPKSRPEIKNRCTQEGVNGENRASIRKSRPEIKNRCTKEGLNGETQASIRKSGLEIKNRCTKEGLNGEILASIRKSKPEIKNRCM